MKPNLTAASAILTIAAGLLAALPTFAGACDGPQQIFEARPLAVRAYVLSTGKKLLTLAGYSGAMYEDPKAMLATVAQALEGRDPREWMLNIGATAVGIGEAYGLAKQRGFTTLGVVSSLARNEQVELAPCVDIVFYVPDTAWGGRTAAGPLSPTSTAMVDSGTEFLAIGGGEVARDEMLAARQQGKPVRFVPADMNHDVARQRAAKKGLPMPTAFGGAAQAALKGGSRTRLEMAVP